MGGYTSLFNRTYESGRFGSDLFASDIFLRAYTSALHVLRLEFKNEELVRLSFNLNKSENESESKSELASELKSELKSESNRRQPKPGLLEQPLVVRTIFKIYEKRSPLLIFLKKKVLMDFNLIK